MPQPPPRVVTLVLCTADGVEVLTAPSEEWPMVVGRFNGQELARPAILVR